MHIVIDIGIGTIELVRLVFSESLLELAILIPVVSELHSEFLY